MPRLERRVPFDSEPEAGERLISKSEVLTRTGLSYPTIWLWMRENRFPRSRHVGGRVKWVASEVDGWIRGLPIKALKGE